MKRAKPHRGLCPGHHSQKRRGADLTPIRPRRRVGEGTLTRGGYVRVVVGGRTVYQHHLVMEDLIGRRLLPEETVHHKNGVRHDNRPENLELWSSSHPPGQRVEDKLSWARDIITLYGDPGRATV